MERQGPEEGTTTEAQALGQGPVTGLGQAAGEAGGEGRGLREGRTGRCRLWAGPPFSGPRLPSCKLDKLG